jgi:hypothetical protein
VCASNIGVEKLDVGQKLGIQYPLLHNCYQGSAITLLKRAYIILLQYLYILTSCKQAMQNGM